MPHIRADGTVLSSKPFSIFSFFHDAFTFATSFVTLFFDSLFCSKSELSARLAGGRGRGLSTPPSTFASRNPDAARQDAARRRAAQGGGGANVRGVGDLRASAAACAGGG